MKPHYGFTDLELNVMKRIADGKSRKEIEFELSLTQFAINRLINRLYFKTECPGIALLTRFAIRQRIIEP